MTAPYFPGLAGALSRAGQQMDRHVGNAMEDHHRQIVSSVIGKQLANSLYAAPADAVVGSNPNAKATPGTPMTGIPGALVKSVVAPVMNHPLASALAGLALPAVAGAVSAGGPTAAGTVDDLGPLLSDLGRGIGHNPEWQSKAIQTLLQSLQTP